MTKSVSSTYAASETYVPRVGDRVTTFARNDLAIPGVVVAANDPCAPVIASVTVRRISACSANAVTLVERGTVADAVTALEEMAAAMRPRS